MSRKRPLSTTHSRHPDTTKSGADRLFELLKRHTGSGYLRAYNSPETHTLLRIIKMYEHMTRNVPGRQRAHSHRSPEGIIVFPVGVVVVHLVDYHVLQRRRRTAPGRKKQLRTSRAHPERGWDQGTGPPVGPMRGRPTRLNGGCQGRP